MVDLSAGQQEALEAVQAWYADGGKGFPEPEVFRLFGYAGTGKTTLARIIVDNLGLDPSKVKYATYTGKAAHVLRQKGAPDASTIHSLIYMPREQAKSRLTELRGELREAERYLASLPEPGALDPDPEGTEHMIREQQHKVNLIRFKIRAEEKRLESPEFLLREPAESTLTGSDLLVLDEVSMVGDPIAADLLGFGVPILALGDPAQLPPVDGGGYFIHREPDALLTEIHRSALDSPVTRIATAVRMANSHSNYNVPGIDGNSGRVRDLDPEQLLDFDQVLVGTNQVRWQAIRTLRRLEGLPDQALPVTGDKIIILANNGEAEVLNGQIYHVEGVDHGRVHDLQVVGEDGVGRELAVHPHGFRGPDGERTARLMGTRGTVAAATFGQAITVHKAQGSQWGRVLVVDESHVFQRMHRGPRSDQYIAGRRWLYTAVTRASDQVVITGSGSIRE